MASPAPRAASEEIVCGGKNKTFLRKQPENIFLDGDNCAVYSETFYPGTSNVSDEVFNEFPNTSIQEGEELLCPLLDHLGQRNSFTPYMRDVLRKQLLYYFMNPFQKWRAKRKLPWKLVLQIVKIIIVTTQLVLFGSDVSKYHKEHLDTTKTFHHLFLKDWDPVREIISYPPSAGPYAVYTKSDFFDHIDYVVKMFAQITNTTIGTYGYDNETGGMSPIKFCKKHYKKGEVYPYNETLNYDNTIECTCLEIASLYPAGDTRWKQFQMRKYLRDNNSSIKFDCLIEASLIFNLKTIYVKSQLKFDTPDCSSIHIVVKYDNSLQDGQVLVTLETISKKLDCRGSIYYASSDKLKYIMEQILNGLVITFCLGSLMLCGRSLYKGQLLWQETVNFFKRQRGKNLSIKVELEFIDFWLVMIMANDILIISGSAIKIQLEQKLVEGGMNNICTILLGSGNLLVWVGLLRYLGFFPKYNILVLTLKRALPNVLRFTLCAMFLYFGFCFCGWVVLGPYHFKFRHLSTTAECLFAMMNGDDLFATFSILNTDNTLLWWFSRFYLYLFISLFIYVVISLFISVIMDSYDIIKNHYSSECLRSELHEFIAECQDDIASGVYHEDTQSCNSHFLSRCCVASCFKIDTQ